VSSCKISTKLVKRLQRYRKSLNISLVCHENGYLRFFRCLNVNNRRKWKLSVVSCLYDCTDLELKLQWLICVVAENFIKISETTAEKLHLTIIEGNGNLWSLISFGRPICLALRNFLKIDQTLAKIS